MTRRTREGGEETAVQDASSGFGVRAQPRAARSLVASGALVVGIGLAGWSGWTSLVMALALTLFGRLAGTAALFAPCALPRFPATVRSQHPMLGVGEQPNTKPGEEGRRILKSRINDLSDTSQPQATIAPSQL
jgi:hypothetical protein